MKPAAAFLCRALISAILPFIVAQPAAAQCPLVGIASDTTTSSRLWDINASSGVPSNPRLVSVAPNRAISSIAFAPWGTLYGTSHGHPSNVPSAGKLYTITSNGIATLVGTMTQYISTEGDIAFDPTTGLLYAVDGVGALFRIDTADASCTSVGNLPTDLPGGADYSGLAFDSSGQLFVWSTFGQVVRTVDKSNANVIGTVALSSSPGGEIGGMAFDPSTGTAYIAGGAGGSAQLSTVVTSTGMRTGVGPLIGMSGVWGISFDTGQCPIAVARNYGAGCISCLDPESFHELFASAAAFDLSHTAMTMIATATGYVLVPGGATFVAPTSSAVALALGDDSQISVTLPFVFPTCSGATTSLTVCSNGFVSVAGGNGTSFTPSVANLLSAPQTSWRSWHDFNPSANGGGQVKFEVIGTVAYVTWDGVFDFGHTVPNTLQFQFDITGNVSLVYETMSQLGNAHVVGYSRGGSSPNHGDLDLSALVAQNLCCTEAPPLRLDVPQRPVVGLAGIPFVTSNIPAGTLVLFVGYGIVKNELGLPVIGSPGCSIYHEWTAWEWVVPMVPSHTLTPFFLVPTIPAAYGFRFFAQSVAFGVPGVPGGWLFSNGVDLTVGY